MWFKNGLKAQKLLAQGVWGKTCESSVLLLFAIIFIICSTYQLCSILLNTAKIMNKT